MDEEEIVRRFTYHTGSTVTINKAQYMRNAAINMARDMVNTAPACRERSVAITKLEEALFWYNAALFRPAPGDTVNE